MYLWIYLFLLSSAKILVFLVLLADNRIPWIALVISFFFFEKVQWPLPTYVLLQSLNLKIVFGVYLKSSTHAMQLLPTFLIHSYFHSRIIFVRRETRRDVESLNLELVATHCTAPRKLLIKIFMYLIHNAVLNWHIWQQRLYCRIWDKLKRLQPSREMWINIVRITQREEFSIFIIDFTFFRKHIRL